MDGLKPDLRNDNSGANVHLAFVNHCGGGWAGLGSLCGDIPMAVNCVNDWLSPLQFSEIVTHEIGHVLGMRHDVKTDPKCGKHNGDYGHMSGTHKQWSSCSKSEFAKLYTKKANNWCLQPGISYSKLIKVKLQQKIKFIFCSCS